MTSDLAPDLAPEAAELLGRAEANRRGVKPWQLRGARYQRLSYDVYAPAHLPVDVLLRARAALHVAGPDAHISHHTAAAIWGIWAPTQSDVHVTVPPGRSRPRRAGLRAHALPTPGAVTQRRGLPISSPVQTFLDLATQLGLVDLVAVADQLVKAKLATPSMLVEASVAWHGKGARVARRAARLCRPGVDSVMETRTRLLIVLAGLPEPIVNHIIRGEGGEWLLRFDMGYPGIKLAVEYDGRQHADSTTQWQRDISRRELADQLGWRIIVVRAPDIFDLPEQTLERVLGAMRDCGMTPSPKLTRSWISYFAMGRGG